jgi:hypothetical protein
MRIWRNEVSDLTPGFELLWNMLVEKIMQTLQSSLIAKLSLPTRSLPI